MDSTWPTLLAGNLLARQVPARWPHVIGVAKTATLLSPLVRDDADLLIAAAWLHDIGCVPTLRDTGFHPLDGARYLSRGYWPARLSALVAHHCAARWTAEARGLGAELAEFDDESATGESAVADVLWYCDLTTGGDGRPVDADEGIAWACADHEPGSGDEGTGLPEDAKQALIAAVRRTEERIARASD